MVLSLYILQNTRTLALLLSIQSALCAYSLRMSAPDISIASSAVEKAHSLLYSPLKESVFEWTVTVFNYYRAFAYRLTQPSSFISQNACTRLGKP